MVEMSIAPSAHHALAGAPSDALSDRPYLSISQTADLLGVSRVTIWRWIRTGRLPVRRLGHRTVRIERADLERMLARDAAPGSTTSALPGPLPEIDSRAAGEADGVWTGPANADEAEPSTCEHFVQFYDADECLQDAVSTFFGTALRAGDAGIVVSTEAHRAGIEDRLRASDLDVSAARTDGRYISLNATETLKRFMVDGAPDANRFADVIGGVVGRASEGGRRVRIFGEMVALLVADGNPAAAIRLEALWNELLQTHRFSLMCAYPMDSFGGEPLAGLLGDVCTTHRRVIPTEGYTALMGPEDRLRAIASLQQRSRSLEAEVARRRQVQQLLHAALASEQRKERELSDFVETAPVGMHWVGPDGTVLWANRAEMELLGFSPDEYIGHHIADFHVDRDVIDDILARLQRGETLSDYPARVRHKDGSIKHVVIDSSVLWEEGRFVHSRCFTRDVTQLRQAQEEHPRLLDREQAARREAQLAARRSLRLQEITRLLSHSLEADQVLADVARSAAELLEAPVGAVFLLDPQEPHGDFALAAAHGIDEARLPDLYLSRHASLAGRALDEGQTLVVDDVRGTHGTALPALLTGESAGSEIAAPIIIGEMRLGVVKAFSPTVRRFSPDDSALLSALAAAAAVALNNARHYREAQNAIQMRDEFLSAASHDLKTPLTVLKATAQLLRRKVARSAMPGAERLASGLATIDGTATKMARQLDELVDVTRVQLGQQLELRRHPTDIVELAHRVAAEQQQGTERHQIHLEAPTYKLIGTWDEVRLGRVLDNLLSNAVKFSPGGGCITVTIAEEDVDGEPWVALAVRDRGLGIPAADLPRVFERFRRAKNVEGRIGGTGIGLASARRIVEQHGGTIAVESLERAGSTFTVRLPLTFTAVDGETSPKGST
jgi:PAS domain S-box-containing protein/excisionase family DNA binding protein